MTIKKGQPGGIAGLDNAGKVPANQTQNIEDLNGNAATAANYHVAESAAVVSNALNAFIYVNALTLVTPFLPAGRYRVGYSYFWNYNKDNADFVGLVEVPGLTAISPPSRVRPKNSSTSARIPHAGFGIVNWPGGVMTVNFSFAKSSNAGTARVYKRTLEVQEITP